MTFPTAKPLSFRLNRLCLNLLSRPAGLMLGAAAALLLMSGQARSTDGAPVAAATPSAITPPAAVAAPAAATQAEAAAPAPSVTAAAPRYPASKLAMAFNYMDADRDGKVSREEASGFRGVAKNFDRADTNHNNILSREEFDRAMNYVKPK